MFAPRPELDNNYTVMGRVVAGMDAVDGIAQGEPPEQPTKIVRAYLGDAAPASASGT
jgi:peptidylprolyl isomerase